jgi:hypothetical protein
MQEPVARVAAFPFSAYSTKYSAQDKRVFAAGAVVTFQASEIAMCALNQIVPWGRSYAEYRQMFALEQADLRLRVLGCADGPASFNAEFTRCGGFVKSVDPLYRFSTEEIRDRISATYQQVLDETQRKTNNFVWNTIRSVEELGRVRMEAMRIFLADYGSERRDERYIAAALPVLPFEDHAFDLALCSHFLFLYSEQLSEEFHLEAIREMCRVAHEVRIFPLLTLEGHKSAYLPGIVRQLRECREVSIQDVPYEFQRGGNQMMRIRAG